MSIEQFAELFENDKIIGVKFTAADFYLLERMRKAQMCIRDRLKKVINMWFKKLYVGTIDLLSGIVEKVAKCDLACKIYKTVFQLGVFPRPKNFCEIARNLIVEKDITYESSILEGNKLDVYYPKNLNKKAPILMWIHGGGYIDVYKRQVLERL